MNLVEIVSGLFADSRKNVMKTNNTDPYGVLGLQTFSGRALFEGFSDRNVTKFIPRGSLPKLRREVVSEYFRVMRGFSPDEKAQLLLGFAKAKGATEATALSGLKLKGWTMQGNPPSWAENAIFSLMLEKGWTPCPVPFDVEVEKLTGNRAIYALFIRWWILSNSHLASCDEVLESLPEAMDRDVAKDWVELFSGHIGRGGNQLVCYIADKKGNALTPLYTSLTDLRDAVQNKRYGMSVKSCAAKYFLCKGYVAPDMALALRKAG